VHRATAEPVLFNAEQELTAERALRLPVARTDGPARLYIKPDDRCEVNDLLGHHLEEAEALEQTLRACVEAAARPGPLGVEGG
jgi:hypothetical protein